MWCTSEIPSWCKEEDSQGLPRTGLSRSLKKAITKHGGKSRLMSL